MHKGHSPLEGVLIEMLMSSDTNAKGHIFGGVVMGLMDKAAALAAVRYSKKDVSSVSAEEINFLTPLHVGEIIKATAIIVYVGRTSMDVEVTVEAENLLKGSTRMAATGRFVMVAVDRQGKPVPIPQWEPETESEKAKYQEALERRNIRTQKINAVK